MSVDVSPGRYPGQKRKSPQSVHPAGKKKKEKENVVTPEDCDPVVREVVEDTRAAVEDMMKELNDMVEQSTPPQFTLTTVYDNAEDNERKSFPLWWTTWCALAMTCVWRHENLKRDGSM